MRQSLSHKEPEEGVCDHECFYFQGLLREDDLEHFDEDFRKNFKTRQADIFSEDGWEGDE